MALVAAACATSTGLHDDLEAVGSFCREHGIWFHVDAAHGAPALLSPAHRHLLRGIEHADSVIWDAHKMMRTSALAAAVLVREERRLEAAFKQKAAYLIYEDADDPGPSLLERQVECTKAPLGMRIFMNLAFRGEEGIGRYVAEQYDKTLRFWELISARPGLRVPQPARVEHPLLPLRAGFRRAGLAARAPAPRGSLPPQLHGGERRALAADERDGAGHERGDDRGAARRYRGSRFSNQ